MWEPRYLAAPGGLSLPAVLADVALLVGGGALAWSGSRRGPAWRTASRPAAVGHRRVWAADGH